MSDQPDIVTDLITFEASIQSAGWEFVEPTRVEKTASSSIQTNVYRKQLKTNTFCSYAKKPPYLVLEIDMRQGRSVPDVHITAKVKAQTAQLRTVELRYDFLVFPEQCGDVETLEQLEQCMARAFEAL